MHAPTEAARFDAEDVTENDKPPVILLSSTEATIPPSPSREPGSTTPNVMLASI